MFALLLNVIYKPNYIRKQTKVAHIHTDRRRVVEAAAAISSTYTYRQMESGGSGSDITFKAKYLILGFNFRHGYVIIVE